MLLPDRVPEVLVVEPVLHHAGGFLGECFGIIVDAVARSGGGRTLPRSREPQLLRPLPAKTGVLRRRQHRPRPAQLCPLRGNRPEPLPFLGCLVRVPVSDRTSYVR